MSDSNVIPFKETFAKCSFCNTSEKDSKNFFSSGTGKYICGSCIIQCKQRIKESEL
jgi:ATP-dependent protease Clp ATPase subunit